MKILGYILLGLFCFFLAAGTFLFIAAPVGFIRDQVVAAVKRETGRDLTIAGDTAISLYPSLGVTLENVELSPPPGMDGGPFVKTASLKLNMPVMARLKRDVVIEQFVLEKPVIDLRVDRNGRESWSFGKSRTADDRGSGGDQALSPELQDFIKNSSNSEGSGSPGGLQGLSLGDVRIVGGTFRYSDARSGTAEELTNVNLTIGLDAFDAPLTANGEATWKGRAIPFEATVTTLADVINTRPAKVDLQMRPSHLNLKFNGTVDPRKGSSLRGAIEISTKSVPELGQWISGNADAAGAIKTASLQGTVSGNKNSVSLTKSRFSLNDLSGTGDLKLRLGERKKISGNITVGDIKTASFISGAEAQGGGSITELSQTDGAGAGGTGGGDSGSRAWSSTPIDFKPLREMDADLKVGFSSIAHNRIRIGKGRMRVGLAGGVLRIEANPLSLYEGGAQGTVVIDARRSVATYVAAMAADRISALPLLKALAGFDWLSGATELRVDVRGRGLSQRQMMRTMGGTASFLFSDGAIEGLNIAKILRGVQSGQFNNFDRVPGEKTDFSRLSASFRIAGGVATNDDLVLQGPLIRAGGKGKANIGAQTIAYRLTPKLVASLEGQGGSDLAGLAVPLRIEGPWARPRIRPDLEGILKDPGSTAAAIDSIGKALGKSKKINSKKVKEVLDGVLGGGDNKKENPLGGLLGDFLQQQ
ncbi:MAG: AsmA family protein [Hyphomicrobiaceae bacterium]